MKLITILSLLLLSACSYHSTMGNNDRFQVDSMASLFAPSITTVTDIETNTASHYAGPSIMGQTLNAAGTVAGGYLLGAGIAKSGDSINNQNAQTASGGTGFGGNSVSGAVAVSGSTAISSSSASIRSSGRD